MGDDSDKSAESSDLRGFKAPLFWPDPGIISVEVITVKYADHPVLRNVIFGGKRRAIKDGYCPELCFPDFNRYGTANELCGEAGFQFEIQPEKYEGVNIAPPLWPSDGHIVFRDVSARYAAHLDPVVRNLTVEIKAGEKHRVSTILDADKIITLENGVMVEYGDPQTLMKKEGSVFASLVSADK